MVYSVPSQLPQHSSFEQSLPAFQTRAPANIEQLTSQLSIPQSHYYNTCDAPSITPQSYAPTTPYQAQGIYRSTTRDHRPSTASEASPYQTEVAEYAQLAMSNPSEHQQPSRGNDSQGQAGGSASEEDLAQYQGALKDTFQQVFDGQLVPAGERLLGLSEWLLNNAVDLGMQTLPLHSLLVSLPHDTTAPSKRTRLTVRASRRAGLTHDDQEQQERRFKLWTDFNHCWLAVLQKQKDTTLAMLGPGAPVPPPAGGMLQEPFLERMGRELVALCNHMERFGLVDYQMGVWEEEIMNGASLPFAPEFFLARLRARVAQPRELLPPTLPFALAPRGSSGRSNACNVHTWKIELR